MFLHSAFKIVGHAHINLTTLELDRIDYDGTHDYQKIGASEGIRTLDTHVGNVMLYQAELRSLPVKL